MPDSGALRYERVANLVQAQIASGALRPSDRVPSIRAMARGAGVSVSTVVQAYVHLEKLGVIESRPQSGFFVRAREQLPATRQLRRARSARPRSVAQDVIDAVLDAFLDKDVVPLGCAVPDPQLYPNRRINALIRQVLRDSPQHAGEMIVPPGDANLRREIARRFATFGAPTPLDDVVITSGAIDAVTLGLGVTCRPGDTVLVESPTYYALLQVIEHLGLRVLEVPNHADTGIDVDAVRQAVRGNRLGAALLVPNFNNPVGSCTPDDAKREIVRLLTEKGVPIIEDDVTGDLPLGGPRPRPMRAFDESGLVITCGSAAKTVALGFRVGWVVSSGFAQELKRAKFLASVAAPTLPQLVLARYFASGGYDRHVRGVRRQLAANVQAFITSVAETFPKGTRVARPAGGSLLWVELPTHVDGTEVFRAALARGVGVMPGVVFSASGRFRNYIRINCGVPWSPRIASAMEKLGRIVARS